MRRTICDELPLHQGAGARGQRRIVLGPAQDLQRMTNRRQRVAQLVRQRREERVLAPIGLDQRGLCPPLLR